jgi:DNA helicase-2/ATP-dependent DNA helicase PcrA
MDHLAGLNPQQREAVLAIDGPLLVLAGAGAGKTRVITHRMLEIIKHGNAPESILAITFTNKAAAEMRERIGKMLDARDGLPFVSTFHSLGLSLIKEHRSLLGYKRTPAIFDRADSMREMKAALKAVGAEDIEPRAALSVASRNKGEGISATEFAEGAQNGRERALGAAWLAYEAALRKDQALDFDDLLLKAVELLKKFPEVREKLQKRWRYIHIDEYQDTNYIQAELAGLLVGPGKNICAVGDIDQTIYSWRGAQIKNLLKFEDSYPGAKIIVLEENYRSTKTILAAANEIIAKNVFRREKNLFTNKAEGEQIALYQAFDEVDEAGFITRILREQIAAGRQPREFAILYRANFQSRAIEEQLLAGDVPYQVLGTRFFERKEVKDILSYIRAALFDTPADIERASKTPSRGIGKVALLAMLMNKEVAGATKLKIESFRSLLRQIKEASEKLPPHELVTYVLVESGMERLLKEDKIEGRERLENVRELAALASRHQSIESFLESAALASDQDELKEDKNAVRLMTVHAAKGLEFPIVFITGLEEGLFPYAREDEAEADKEEERRLMYVAITRAEEKLYLTYAAYRTVFGSKTFTESSQFLTDIPDYLLKPENPERLGRTIYLD